MASIFINVFVSFFASVNKQVNTNKQESRRIQISLIKFQILGITEFTRASHLFDNEGDGEK